MSRIYSFDVFDTCITRRVACPSDVFFKTAEIAYAAQRREWDEDAAQAFVAARIRAEQSCRLKSEREEITLNEIWRELAASIGWPNDPALSGCELEAEKAFLCPIFETRRKIGMARESGSRVVFISDSYLPREFIAHCLISAGCMKPEDGLYVSSEIGVTKASGNLFRHVLRCERVAADKVYHYGDNGGSDCVVPRRLGLNVERLEYPWNTSEKRLLRASCGAHDAVARVAGAARAFRLGLGTSEQSGASNGVGQLLGGVTAPLALAFSSWVLDQARRDGISRLYFLSRDCQLLFKVAQQIASSFGAIECRYLYASRQALYLPSIRFIAADEMPWMRRDFEEAILERLLAKIGLRYEDVERHFDSLARESGKRFKLTTDDHWNQFWAILKEEPCRSLIENLRNEREAAARAYFESEGLLESRSWALVDIGWTLNSQRSLSVMLKKWGWNGELNGYYLGLNRDRIPPSEAGNSRALFYEPSGDRAKEAGVSPVFALPVVLEHVVGCADHPSVSHYSLEDNAERVVFNESSVSVSPALAREMHDIVLQFTAANRDLVPVLAAATECRNVIEGVLDSLLHQPVRAMVEDLQNLSAANDQNGLDTSPMVRRLTLKYAISQFLPKRLQSILPWSNTGCIWESGSRTISSVATRFLLSCSDWLRLYARRCCARFDAE